MTKNALNVVLSSATTSQSVYSGISFHRSISSFRRSILSVMTLVLTERDPFVVSLCGYISALEVQKRSNNILSSPASMYSY